mgnify:FL=1
MLKKLLLIISALILIIGLTTLWIFNLPDFGRLPQGERLERIYASKNFENGTFVSPETTQSFLKKGFLRSMVDFLFESKNVLEPSDPLPSVKTDLKSLDPGKDLIVWMGHSSFYMQLAGKRFLIDPVFSGHASPFSFMLKAYKGSDVYSSDDLPPIDALLISHDHWDHLDHETITKLKDKIATVITGLGCGEHFEYWGYDKKRILEQDWYDEAVEIGDVKIYLTPARHFSGRLFKRNPTLPVSFVIISPQRKIFYSGDSGFGKHFAEIAERFGPFDLAVMENGQYNKQWPYVHMFPEEMIKASAILGAKRVLPVHNSKFTLSEHKWDEPLRRAEQAAKEHGIMLETPRLGESLSLKAPKALEKWWQEIR